MRFVGPEPLDLLLLAQFLVQEEKNRQEHGYRG
jgi:hypothetical protein